MSQQLTPELQAVKNRIKSVWSNGDFGILAKVLEPEEKKLFRRLSIPKGASLLDVACGSGTIALEAARNGIKAKGLDIVEDLIRQAQESSRAENLEIDFIVGDAEDMPYADSQFDFVITVFGAMFCPRPLVAAGELFRVCRPGGNVVMGNWTTEGEINDFFDVVSKYSQPQPPGVPSPMEWGTRKLVEERIGSKCSNLEMEIRKLIMDFPMAPPEVSSHYIKYFGPTKTVYDMLEDKSKAEFERDLTEVWVKNNKGTPDNTIIEADYLQVVATKK